MAKRLVGYINLSKCNIKEKLFTNKNGEKCINVVVWFNDIPDQFGNIASVQIQSPQGEAKVYVGNLKEPLPPQQKEEPKTEMAPVPDDDFIF